MDNGQSFSENKTENNQKSSNGCLKCCGCFSGCVFVIGLIISLCLGGTYWFINEKGRDILADQIEKMTEVVTDSVMTDETLKQSLKSNIKDFTNKIRNKEIDLDTIMINMRKMEKDGTPLKFTLFAIYGDSLTQKTVINSDEQKNLQKIINGLLKNKLNTTQLASFTQIMQTVQTNQYDMNGKKKIDEKKMHQALSELEKIISENKLEDPGDSFNFEEIITNEINKLLKTLSDGKNAITGKDATKLIEQMESKDSETDNK